MQSTALKLLTFPIRVGSIPVHSISDRLHQHHMAMLRKDPRKYSNGIVHYLFHNKSLLRIIVGSTVMIISAALTRMCPSWIPDCIWDSATWLMHGLGAAPIAQIICNLFGWDFGKA